MRFDWIHFLASGVALVLAAGGVAAAADDASATHATINPMAALDKGMFKGFLEKPLFDPARSLPPPPPPVVMAPPPPPTVAVEPPPNVHLLGIIQGDLDLAIVRRDGDNATQILSSGDHIDNWEVTVLPTGALRLRNGDRTADYALFDKASTGVATTPSTADAEAAPHLPPDLAHERNIRLQARTY